MKDDRLYLIHISECVARIEGYVAAGREEFLGSSLVQDAVVRNLQVLAESTQRLSDTLKNKTPDVDWKAISGFRNVLVHDYLGLDLKRIWEIVQTDLPKLKAAINALQ